MDGFLFVKNLVGSKKLVILPMLKRNDIGKMFHVKHILTNVKNLYNSILLGIFAVLN